MYRQRAKVILIAGPVQQGTYFPMHQYYAVESAQEMFELHLPPLSMPMPPS